jgi:hypothetical protein
MASHAALQRLLWIKTNKNSLMCKTSRYAGGIVIVINIILELCLTDFSVVITIVTITQRDGPHLDTLRLPV